MRKAGYISIVVVSIIFLIAALCGCRLEKSGDKKIKDLDYTICDESKLPDELKEIIKDKKKEPFKLTYRTKEYLYIVVGYGAQDRTDLNVKMTELYLAENAIYVDTDLESVETTTLADHKVTFPWIAVKCELYDVQVNFR